MYKLSLVLSSEFQIVCVAFSYRVSVLITFILASKFYFMVFLFFQLYADNFHIDEH